MDPFALLSSGARFDKRKQPGSVSRPPGSFSVAQPLPEQQQQPSRKKRKKQQGAAASGEQVAIDADAGFSLFGGSLQQAQVQQQQQQQQLEAALPEVHTRDPQEEANVIRKALRIKVCTCVGMLLPGMSGVKGADVSPLVEDSSPCLSTDAIVQTLSERVQPELRHHAHPFFV